MKRKAEESGCSENEQPDQDNQGQADKRTRKSVGSMGSSGDSYGTKRVCKQWSCDVRRSGVNPELLQEMGVEILDDNSGDSCSSAASNWSKNSSFVLKPKNTNVQDSRYSSVDMDEYLEDLDESSLNDSYSSLGSKPTSLMHHGYALKPNNTSFPEFFLKHTSKNVAAKQNSGLKVFSWISDEVILQIFKWLTKSQLARCSLVCRRWNHLSKDETLWRRVDLGVKTVPPGVVGQVLERGVQVLRLARASVIGPIFMSPYTQHPTFSKDSESKLQYLDLSMATIQLSCLENLLSTCKHLKKLALENCKISQACCESIAKNPSLEVLHMAMCQGFTDVGLKTMLENCDRLEEVNLSWGSLTVNQVKIVCGSVPTGLVRLCLTGNRQSLKDEDVEVLVQRANMLRELDLSDATLITSTSVSSIVSNLPRLESLSMSRCYGVVASSYLLLSKCPTLLYLNIFGLLKEESLDELRIRLKGIDINKHLYSAIARPTIGIKRSSIWNLRVRDQ